MLHMRQAGQGHVLVQAILREHFRIAQERHPPGSDGDQFLASASPRPRLPVGLHDQASPGKVAHRQGLDDGERFEQTGDLVA